MAPRLPEAFSEQFLALDHRVGRVEEVEAFRRARTPAWKLAVDFGSDVGVLGTSAQITSYKPEELVGRPVVGVLNLGTKRDAGFPSESLVLGAVRPDGRVLLLGVDPGAQPGELVG